MTWHVDLTTGVRADLVGLPPEAADALTDALVAWLEEGPPRENQRTLQGIDFYEAAIVERYLLAYVVDDARQRFVLLWLRYRPGVPSVGDG